MMKMRNLFFKLSMLLFVLGMSVNAAWANLSDVPEEQMAQLMTPIYKAQLTGNTSSTGGGKVYVVLEENDPRCEDNSCWIDGTSNVALFGLGITTIESMPMTKANFRCWAQKDPGYFFTGWSFSNWVRICQMMQIMRILVLYRHLWRKTEQSITQYTELLSQSVLWIIRLAV